MRFFTVFRENPIDLPINRHSTPENAPDRPRIDALSTAAFESESRERGAARTGPSRRHSRRAPHASHNANYLYRGLLISERLDTVDGKLLAERQINR